MYDLVLRGARVIDPGRGVDTVADLGLRDGRIATIADEIAPGGRHCPVDLADPGRYVLPGLIDLHAHTRCGMAEASPGLSLADPDQSGVRAGVTTLVDAGSAGVGRWHDRPGGPEPGPLGTTVLSYLNVGTNAHDRPAAPDVREVDDIDRERIADAVGRSAGGIAGLKLRLVGPLAVDRGEELIDRAKGVARDCLLPLMVHIGQPYPPPGADSGRGTAVTLHLLRTLDRGDIVTHLCTPFAGGLGGLAPAMRAAAHGARRRGVLFDVGVGRRQFSHQIARLQRAAGFPPDTVSTDMTAALADSTSLVQVMSMLMAVGYSFTDVVAMATVNAAAALGRPGLLGAVAQQGRADLSVVDLVAGDFRHTDGTGAEFDGAWGIRPVLTVKGGRLIEPGAGPHPWGWLPSGDIPQ